MIELSCPKCKVGIIQRSTIYIEGERYNAFGCNKCDYGYWELFVDAKTYTVSTEGTADQFAKDISEISDEEGIKTNEVDKMIEARGWICDWDVSTAERVEKLIIEQMNLVHELSMENEEHRKVFAEIFLALGTDETDRTKWAGMIREMKKESK